MAGLFRKQFIDAIEWNEPDDGILSYRYPMHNLEIKYGGQLTVRRSQMAAFVSKDKIADVFEPGRHALDTRHLPILAGFLNWDKHFDSPFKSALYFFSTRLQLDRKWGTSVPIAFRDKEFGAVQLRGFGTYSYRIADAGLFFNLVSGTREVCLAADIDARLRDTIVDRIADGLARSKVPFRNLAANKSTLAEKIGDGLKLAFAALGLELTQFVIEDVSIPRELAKDLNQRIGIKREGDMTRYEQNGEAEALDLTVGGAAARIHAGSRRPPVVGTLVPVATAVASAEETKFCIECGKAIPLRARLCTACKRPQ